MDECSDDSVIHPLLIGQLSVVCHKYKFLFWKYHVHDFWFDQMKSNWNAMQCNYYGYLQHSRWQLRSQSLGLPCWRLIVSPNRRNWMWMCRHSARRHIHKNHGKIQFVRFNERDIHDYIMLFRYEWHADHGFIYFSQRYQFTVHITNREYFFASMSFNYLALR